MPAVYLIRHGQASFGAEDYDQLSELGVEQAGLLGRALKGAGIGADQVICGGMKRHTQTAGACLAAMGAARDWRTDEGFAEFDHLDVIGAHRPELGSMAALVEHLADSPEPKKDFQALFDAALGAWIRGDGEYQESWPAFQARVMASLEGVLHGLGRGRAALVFTSGGVISAAAQALLGFEPARVPVFNAGLANAAITRVVSGRGGARMLSFNEHVFLPGALVSYR